MHSRRAFLGQLAACAVAWGAGGRVRTWAQATTPFAVTLPPFMAGRIQPGSVAYLNEAIPAVFAEHHVLFPVLAAPPAWVIIDTHPDVLRAHGDVRLAYDLLGEEALTLQQAQYLLVTLRFNSVATPHRGNDPARFGQAVYAKQYPRLGYRYPRTLILEEILHAQQDMTVMRLALTRDNHDPALCLHGPLKGLSELGAHAVLELLGGLPDYVFLLGNDPTPYPATEALIRLAHTLGLDAATLAAGLLYDADAYSHADDAARAHTGQPLWALVTPLRPSRDAEGRVIALAPAVYTP